MNRRHELDEHGQGRVADRLRESTGFGEVIRSPPRPVIFALSPSWAIPYTESWRSQSWRSPPDPRARHPLLRVERVLNTPRVPTGDLERLPAARRRPGLWRWHRARGSAGAPSAGALHRGDVRRVRPTRDRRRTVNAESGFKRGHLARITQEPSMSTSATLPNTIQIRPSRLAGLLVAVAIVTGVTTWSVSQVTTESHASGNPKPDVSRPGRAPPTKAYMDGVIALDAEQRAATLGTCTRPSDMRRPSTSLSPEQQAAIWGNVSPDPSVRRHRHRNHSRTDRRPSTATCTRPSGTRTPRPACARPAVAATLPLQSHRLATSWLRGCGR